MANYPTGVYTPRTRINKSGVVYDPTKQNVLFVEDVNKTDDEVVAIETELGASPKGTYGSLALRLADLLNIAGNSVKSTVDKIEYIVQSRGYGGQIAASCISGNYIYVAGLVTFKIYKYEMSTMRLIATSASYGYQINALATNGTNIYAGGSTLNKVRKYLMSDMSYVGQSSDYGGSIFALCVQGTKIYAGGSGDYKIKAYLLSDLSDDCVSVTTGNQVVAICCDSTYLYCTSVTNKTVQRFLLSDMSYVDASSAMGGNAVSMAISGGYLIVGCATVLAVYKIRTSDMATIVVSDYLMPTMYGVATDGNFIYVDAAKLLGLNFMCAHTVADNCVANFLQKKVDAEKPETIKDLLELLLEIPEYSLSEAAGVGPSLIAGRDNAKAGRIMVDMTGGTEGSKELIEKWARAGVNTVVGMHFSEEHRKEMDKHFINAVIAGHISSDNLGLNLLFDEIIKKGGKLEFIECSGFRRVKR